MTSRRPSLASGPRPSSAIFIGSELTLPLPSTPPSPAHSVSSTRSQLPSPPATNSTGSIGDSNSTDTGSVKRSGMVNADTDRRTSFSDEDDDQRDHENDEDHTAKFYNGTRITKGKQPESASSTIQRVKSLTEKNRKFIDRLSSITFSDSLSRSSPSTHSRASSSHSRSALPPTFSSSSPSFNTGSTSRVSYEASPRGGSGSETEREREQRHTIRQDAVAAPRSRPGPTWDGSSDDNDAITPPASARRPTPTSERAGSRQRLRSAPSPPPKSVTLTPRKHTSTNFSIIGSGRRSRRVSIQQPDDDLKEEGELSTSPTVSANTNKRSRAPLPREFVGRRSPDNRSPGEPSNQERERTTSPGILTARGSASANSSGAGGTFSMSPVSPRSQRPARPSTLRESSRRVQRWSSVDDPPMNGDDDRRRQWRHGGSAESPLASGTVGVREGRSVVAEGLRAAGLARREDVFVDQPARTRTSVKGGELDELRRGIVRVLEPRTPLSAPGHGSAGIHSVLTGSGSRAGTVFGSYEDFPRAASQPLHRRTPQARSVTAGLGTAPPPPSSEHARLMLDALSVFEAQLARLPAAPSPASDLARTAQSLAHSAATLNALLRAANARALESQIEAEVGDEGGMVDATEVWRRVGGEYRETVRVSDELVRSVTGVLLGVGRLVREVGGGGGGSGRTSLDGDGARGARRSVDSGWDGRNVEGSAHREREARRSWDDDSRRSRDLASRPSTSLSMTRAAEEDGEETARENGDRSRPSTLERLSLRRIFSPRTRDTAYPSPTPLPRERDQNATVHQSLPPPLPTLPSERTSSAKASARRAKFSNTSVATVRGTSTSAILSPPNPTTALTPHTVSAGVRESFPLIKGDSTSSSALSGIQQKDGRKRTMSASGGSGEAATNDMKGAGERRERRRTIDDVFP